MYLFIWPHWVACGILVPWPGIQHGPLQWKHSILTTGPPGKSLCHILDSACNDNIWYLSFSVWLTSLSVIISSCSHVAANGTVSFFFMTNIPLYMYKPHLLYPFICRGHLGCFHVLATVNSATMNIGVHVSFWIIVLSGYLPRSGIFLMVTYSNLGLEIGRGQKCLLSQLPSSILTVGLGSPLSQGK